MASINFAHTVQKYVQLTDQTLLNDLDNLCKAEKDKKFVSVNNFQATLKNDIQAIYNSAVQSLNEDEGSLEELKKQQDNLFKEYTTAYKRLLAENNLGEEGNTSPTTSSYDIDPVNKETGTDTWGQMTYATFYGDKTYKNVSSYAGTNNTFSMCDMVCTIDIVSNTGQHIISTLGKLQTLSYSIYQNKTPVRMIGNMNARDYVYGQRTIAGSLVFAVFNKHWLNDLYEEVHDKSGMKNWRFIADEIPPFNISISFANEYGFDSRMAIYGVRLVNEGQTMSINDIYIENTYQYVATDIEIMDSLNSWQSSNRLNRRYNMASVITTGQKQDSTTGTPQMQGQQNKREENGQGQEQSNQSDKTTATFLVPDKLIDLIEEQYKTHTEAELKAALKSAHDQYINTLQESAELAKKNRSEEAQKAIDEARQKAEYNIGGIFSKQWDEITTHYEKQKKDEKTA